MVLFNVTYGKWKMVQDIAMLTMVNQLQVVYNLSDSAIFNDWNHL